MWLRLPRESKGRKSVTYTYDAADNLETVTDWLSKQTVYIYDDAGNLDLTYLPNGVWTDHTFDYAGRLQSVLTIGPGPAAISSFLYTLDAVGNRTGMEDMDGIHSYDYDPLYRLEEVTYPDLQMDTYTYDDVGNRETLNATTYTYDDADQMLTAGAVTYGYDDNGNQTSRGTDIFEYDHENRLTEAVIEGDISSSLYNGDGLRMSHTVNGVTTSYIWDVAAGLPVILQDSQGNTYVYGLDLISATDGSGVQTYHLYDGLGSTSGLTDGSGNVVDGYTYDAFGALRSGSPGATDFLFTGEQRDADSEMYYLRARYYDPETGRFLGRDPVPSANLYAYVGNNPVRYVDPYGLFDLGDLNPIDDILDCVEDPIECGEDIGGAIVDAVDSFASNPAGALALCNPANPFWAIGCTIVVASNPEVIPYIITGVQIADIAPIPGPAGAILEIAAFFATQYQILSNECLSSNQKVLASEANVLNVALGGLAKALPPAEWVAVPYELANFTGGTFATTCTVAHASGAVNGSMPKE